MRAFFQELKTNERRHTAPKGGRRPIRFRRQAPALGRPHGIDHIRAPSTPTRGPITLFALPRPTAHHGRRPGSTRHPNPRPRTNQQQRPRPHANNDLRPQHRPHTGPDRPHTPPSQRLHHLLEECFVSGARFDRSVHRDAAARVVAGESATAVARDVGCRRGTVSQWCREAGWSWSGGRQGGSFEADQARRARVVQAVLGRGA